MKNIAYNIGFYTGKIYVFIFCNIFDCLCCCSDYFIPCVDGYCDGSYEEMEEEVEEEMEEKRYYGVNKKVY